MKDQLTDEQNEALLQALSEAIDNGPWDKTSFLKVIGKNLNEIRDNFLTQLGSSNTAKLKTDSNLANRVALRSGQQEVYVSLYSSDGGNLQSWEKIIANLPRQMVSRPIYADEDDVKAAIKSKENKQNEAYVAIYINQTDILQIHPDKVSVDKLGKKLLTLKDKTLNLDNIARFIHHGIVYKYSKNRLVKIT